MLCKLQELLILSSNTGPAGCSLRQVADVSGSTPMLLDSTAASVKITLTGEDLVKVLQ